MHHTHAQRRTHTLNVVDGDLRRRLPDQEHVHVVFCVAVQRHEVVHVGVRGGGHGCVWCGAQARLERAAHARDSRCHSHTRSCALDARAAPATRGTRSLAPPGLHGLSYCAVAAWDTKARHYNACGRRCGDSCACEQAPLAPRSHALTRDISKLRKTSRSARARPPTAHSRASHPVPHSSTPPRTTACLHTAAMSGWLSDAWTGVRDRASKMSLSQWLVVGAVATAAGLVLYRRERRKAYNRMIASWVREPCAPHTAYHCRGGCALPAPAARVCRVHPCVPLRRLRALFPVSVWHRAARLTGGAGGCCAFRKWT